MPKYLVLYEATVSAAEQMANATPEQAQAGMEAWMAWARKAGPKLVDIGSPVGAGQKVTSAGRPSASGSQVAGFSILQAESSDALRALLEGHPHLMMPGTAIHVHEFLPLPGM